MHARLTAEQYLDTAMQALATGDVCHSLLDRLPVPIYTTDAGGAVTYWNRACVEFAGREPELGEDRWCVTWQIYTTTGDFLPHDQCPMAQAIREKREIRARSQSRAARPPAALPPTRPVTTLTAVRRGQHLIDVSAGQATSADQAQRCAVSPTRPTTADFQRAVDEPTSRQDREDLRR